MSSIRVVLADDHTIMRHGPRSVLARQEDLAVVGEGNDGREAAVQTRIAGAKRGKFVSTSSPDEDPPVEEN